MRSVLRSIHVAVMGLMLPMSLVGQETSFAAATTADVGEGAASTTAVTAPASKDSLPLTHRWLDLKTFSHAQRYRNTYNQGGAHLFESGQQRSLLEGRVKLDADAKYTIGFRASSGHYFNWAFADYAGETFTRSVSGVAVLEAFTPAQQYEIYSAFSGGDPAGTQIYTYIPSNGWYFYTRELYLSATPVKPVTVEFGSFGFERGLGTEITTFDDDGYLVGERVRLHDAKHLFFDEVGATYGFFGDAGTPNLFDRGASFKHFNYRQAFVKKQVTKRLGFSGDYTSQVGTHTVREAAVFGLPETKVADKVRVELYQRLNSVTLQGTKVDGGNGFAVAFEKKVGTRVSGDIGYANIDQGYTAYTGSRFAHAVGFSLNGDTYGLGKRPFAHASVKLTSVVTAFGFYTHAVGSRQDITFNRQGLNAGLNFDMKALLNTEKKIF